MTNAGWIDYFARDSVNALLGNKVQALADLKRAFNNRSGWLVFLEQEPAFDALKSEPEFQDLVRHIRR